MAKYLGLSKAELEKKLEDLKKEKSKVPDWAWFASCYARALIEDQTISAECNHCGKTFEFQDSWEDEDIDQLEEYAERCRALGYEAAIYYLCDDCMGPLNKNGRLRPAHLVFSFRTKGMDRNAEYPISSDDSFCLKKLQAALDFLEMQCGDEESYEEIFKKLEWNYESFDYFEKFVSDVLGIGGKRPS